MKSDKNTAPRAYGSADFALELGQDDVGFPRSVEGGNLKTEILTRKVGGKYDIWRQLSKPKIEDIKLQVGFAMSKTFYTWMEGFFSGEVERKDGAIVVGDFHYIERGRRTFSNALISEIGFPKLDATDKSACYMNVTLAPEALAFEPAKKDMALSPTVGSMNQKLWTAANFVFSIDGMDDACVRVSQVDQFVIKQKIMEYASGASRLPIKVPGPIEWPNLTFTVPEVDADPFIAHFTEYAMSGVEQDGKRLTGYIEYQDHECKALGRIQFFGADIASIEPDKSDADAEEIKKVKIQISTEYMQFSYETLAEPEQTALASELE